VAWICPRPQRATINEKIIFMHVKGTSTMPSISHHEKEMRNIATVERQPKREQKMRYRICLFVVW